MSWAWVRRPGGLCPSPAPRWFNNTQWPRSELLLVKGEEKVLSESTSISSSGPFLREISVLKIFNVCFLPRNEWGAYLPTKVQLSKFPVLPNGLVTYMLPAVFMSADGFLVKVTANNHTVLILHHILPEVLYMYWFIVLFCFFHLNIWERIRTCGFEFELVIENHIILSFYSQVTIKALSIGNKLQNKAKQKHIEHYIPIRMAKIFNSDHTKSWQGCGVIGTLLHCWWECKQYRHFGRHFGNSLWN